MRHENLQCPASLPDGPPRTEAELMARVDRLAGRTLGELAGAIDEPVPPDLRRKKGWVGELIERLLGASAGNLPEPDFMRLGVELKTLPVDATGKPLETTYVCTVPLTEVEELRWADSRVRKKLARVLWVPVWAERDVPLAHRMVGQAILWSPTPQEEAVLRRDWEEHIDTIRQGFVEGIGGRDGVALQIRPKAANASKLTWSIDERGEAIMTLPRGFYLRTLFTEALVRRRFG